MNIEHTFAQGLMCIGLNKKVSKEFNCSIVSVFFRACAPKAPNIIAKKPKAHAASSIFFSMDYF